MTQKTGSMVKCNICGKEKYMVKSRLKGKHYCSQKCRSIAWKGPANCWVGANHSSHNNGAWKGGMFVDKNTGYKMILIIGKGTYTTEQKILMEKLLGRKLSRSEVVHHINGNKLDNRLENLEVMSRSQHINLHRKTIQSARQYMKELNK